MQRNFLVYWNAEEIAAALQSGTLSNLGSDQLTRISVTDRLWICGRSLATNELFTIGYLDVDKKLLTEEARVVIAERYPGRTPYPSKWQVLASQGKECRPRMVPLGAIYKWITFDSKQHRRLTLENGHPDPQQLQSFRQLMPRAVQEIEKLWSAGQ